MTQESKEVIETFTNLIAQSEAKTNEMVCKLSDSINVLNNTLNSITNEYTTQLAKAQECRDKALDELKLTIQMLDEKERNMNILLNIIRDEKQRSTVTINK